MSKDTKTTFKLGEKLFEAEWKKALAAGYKGSKREFMEAFLKELRKQPTKN
jgi:hypothetical protein